MSVASPPIAERGDPGAPIIVARGVTKRYRANVVLDGVDFELRPGVTGLLGPNGAGKTTLLSLILGLQRVDGGSLQVLGLDPRSAGPDIRARVGYSPEHHLLPPDLPANDFVRHLAEVHGMPRREAVARSSDALWYVGLGEERFRMLGTMSTGQRQRVKLAMAIAHDPALVLLDEPTDGLDPTQRETMLDLIRRFGSEFGMSVLLSSHLLDEVERTCDNVIIIGDGSVVAAGSIDSIRGEGRGVQLEVDGGADQLVGAFTGRGLQVTADRQRLVIETGTSGLDQGALLTLVRDEVASRGVGLRRLHPRTVSLEDVYLGIDR